MIRRILAAALIAALAATPGVIAPATATPAQPATPETAGAAELVDPAAFEPDEFYTPPAELPPAPGVPVKTDPVLDLPEETAAQLDGALERIMYTSTTIHGEVVPVTGYLIEPARAWEGQGPTPTVVFAPSTRGAGDKCAPSHDLAATPLLDSHPEFIYHSAASLAGMRVVVTDYIGLGTPGPHTYAHNTEQAHAVLDAARAGLAVAGVPADSPVGFWGFSQGGGAAAAAAEQAATYAPELNIKGTYAGAPPASLAEVLDSVDGTGIAGVLGYGMVGFSARDPEFAAALDRILNPLGREFVADNAEACIGESVERWGMTESATLTVTGEPLIDAVSHEPVFRDTFARERLGQSPVTGPILIGASEVDDFIANDQVQQLGRDYCAAGSEVYYRHTSVPSLTSSQPLGIDHTFALVSDTPESMDFLIDRFNDVPAPTNCGTY